MADFMPTPTRSKRAQPKIEHFDIIFGNADDVFYAGQDVTGTVVLSLEDEKNVNEILLELKGNAKTYWSKHSGTSRKHFSDNESYFCEQFNTKYTHLFGTKPAERILPRGRHEIPFRFRLPASLPSSFEGEYGCVRYRCTATIECPWTSDTIARKAFTVIGVEDLNDNKDALEPVRLKECEFDVRFCCHSRGTIVLSMSLAKKGYVPGETIRINAEIRNNSSKTVRCATARLRQHVCYQAKSSSAGTCNEAVQEETLEIARKQRGTIAPRRTQEWVNEKLEIPPVPPKLMRCKIIDVSYTLELDVENGLVIIAPIIVGTVPLLGSIEEIQKQPLTPDDVPIDDVPPPVPQPRMPSPTAPTFPTPFPDPPAAASTTPNKEKKSRKVSRSVFEKYPTLPAPTYEAYTFRSILISSEGSVADSEEARNSTSKSKKKPANGESAPRECLFAPKYAMYRTLHAPSPPPPPNEHRHHHHHNDVNSAAPRKHKSSGKKAQENANAAADTKATA